MSVIRSATPLHKTKEDANANKICAIVGSTADRIKPHVHVMCAEDHQQAFNNIEQAMTKAGHFQQQRINKKLANFDDKGDKCKKQNAAQQIREQQQTPAATGLIPIGKMFQTKEGHMEALEVELCHRGVPIADVNKMKVTARKDKLKELESKRLVDEEGMEAKSAADRAKKHFKKLSTAVFQFAD